jgi:hypothetical protein
MPHKTVDRSILYRECIDLFRAAIKSPSTRASLLPSAGNNMQKLIHKIDNTYQAEETRCNNNQPEIYNDDQE